MTMRQIHLHAEQTLPLPHRSLGNLWRRVLGKRPTTYRAHVVAGVVARWPLDLPDPRLVITVDGKFRLVAAVVSPPAAHGGHAMPDTLRVHERGGGRRLKAELRYSTPLEESLREAGTALARNVSMFVDGVRLGGVTDLGAEGKPAWARNLADGGKVTITPSKWTEAEQMIAAGGRVVPDTRHMGDLSPEVVLPQRVAAMMAELADVPKAPDMLDQPSVSTTVLHDLAFIAEQLETAQFQIAMSAGGDDAGSAMNAAYVALCAVETVQAKLAVVTDAADMAELEANGALARLEAQRQGETGAKRKLNRCREMLAIITRNLPKKDA